MEQAPKNRILVVDDDPVNIMHLTEILNNDYDLFAAKDGAAAIQKALKVRPDLILLDIIMPEMNGYQVLEQLKACSELKDIPVIFVTGLDKHEDEIHGLNAGAVDFIIKPFRAEIAKLRVDNHIELKNHRQNLEELVDKKVKELISTKEIFLDTLADMIEYRSLESGKHIQRTKRLTGILIDHLLTTEKLGPILKKENINSIIMASSLHDIGKFGIPDSILLKPGKLTKDEFAQIKTHTIIGSEMIKSIESKSMKGTNETDDYIRHSHDIARYHHERWDGTGYPDRLKGSEIPLTARIVALVDVYDALTNERCYKSAVSHEEAMKIIKNGAGHHFDSDIVQAMMAVQDKISA